MSFLARMECSTCSPYSCAWFGREYRRSLIYLTVTVVLLKMAAIATCMANARNSDIMTSTRSGRVNDRRHLRFLLGQVNQIRVRRRTRYYCPRLASKLFLIHHSDLTRPYFGDIDGFKSRTPPVEI